MKNKKILSIFLIVILFNTNTFAINNNLSKKIYYSNKESFQLINYNNEFKKYENYINKNIDIWNKKDVNEIIYTYNNIPIYKNGYIYSNLGKWNSLDNYYYGHKWQCVEFVRRYYHDILNHNMPSKWGNAKDYFDYSLKDGNLNKERNLYQYNSHSLPHKNDIIIFDGRFGHVAIVAKVLNNAIIIIQQNTLKPIDIIYYEKIGNKINYTYTKNIIGYLSLNEREE